MSNKRMPSHIQTFDHYESESAPWVILFHGFGADAHDLESLKDVVPLSSPVNWKFPNGVFEVPIGPGWTGRAWWPLRLTSLPDDWSNYTPDEMNQLLPLVFAMIESMRVPWNKIIIGGFSQGAMLANEVYLQAPEKPLGLISLSGSLIREETWKRLMPQRLGEKIFLSHGEQDQVLPCKGSQKLLQLYKQNKVDCQWISFQGGHEIPTKVIQGMGQYIQNQINR